MNIKTKDPPKRNRSSAYDVAIAEVICDRLVDGESLRAICADPRMPSKATVCRWLARNEEFRCWYALARQGQAEDLLFEILEIADDSTNVWVDRQGKDGQTRHVFNRDAIRRAKLRIAARKRHLAMLMPKKYGDGGT